MAKKVFIIGTLLFAVSLTGCKRFVYIHDRYPEYKAPPKAYIHKLTLEDLNNLDPEVRAKVIDSVKNLKVEASQLRAILDSYNGYAQRKNSEYDALFKR
jgi:hypothetical protein